MKFLFLLICSLFLCTDAASVIPNLSTISGGPMSPHQIYQTVSNLYSSPLAQYLPPMSDMIETALKVNIMSKTIQESSDAINKIMKDAVNKLASDFGVRLPSTQNNPVTTLQNLVNILIPTTTKASILGSISNWFSRSTTVKPLTNNPFSNLIHSSG